MKATKIIGRAVFVIFKSLINLDLLYELPVAHELHAGHLHGITSGFTAYVFRGSKYQMHPCKHKLLFMALRAIKKSPKVVNTILFKLSTFFCGLLRLKNYFRKIF
jgi:hypothetical protein